MVPTSCSLIFTHKHINANGKTKKITLRRHWQRQANFSKFKASLVYVANFRAARDTQGDFISKSRNNNNNAKAGD